jgi:Outer membrane protein beta-barrel domain
MVALLAGNVLPASAQTPEDGMLGAGGDIGAFFPDDAFEDALTVDAFGEYYITPRFSGRVMLTWTNPGVNGFTEDHFRQVKLLFNGVYNWELGVWHPYATAGAGAYFVRLHREDRPDPDGETRGGLNLGGGIEYFLNNLTAVKGELRWDVVSHPTGLPDATGVSLTIGVKRYFRSFFNN